MLSRLVRQTALTASKRATASQYGLTLVKGLSTQPKDFNKAHITEDVPKEDYYDGHLLADHLEYIDDMIDKTVELKESLTELKQSKEDALLSSRTAGIRWTDSADIDRLFENTKKTKAELAAQHEQLVSMMAAAKKIYAVDGPDGDSDAHLKEEVEEINHIIADAAKVEDADEINYQHKMADAKKTYAVDGPDGDSDAHLKEEVEEINHIIADAAKVEDADKINYQHKMEEAVRKDRARDPEHDW